MLKELLGASARTLIVGRVVTATITLICVLIVYDGWANLRLRDAVLIVVGPVLAIYTSHLFSGTLVQQIDLGRRPTGREWMTTVRFESRFLLLGVPPIAMLLVLDIFGVSLSDSIQAIVWLEALSLGFWSGLAAHLAGLQGRSLVLAVLWGLLVAVIVLTLQLILQPGKQIQQEVATTGPAHAVPIDARPSPSAQRRFQRAAGWSPSS